MKYIKTTKATNWTKESFSTKLIRWLLWFIPSPNRKNEQKFHLLNEWLLEFDDKGEPLREIGLDKSGKPIIKCAVDNSDYGFWLDTNMRYEDFLDKDSSIIDEKYFNSAWSLSLSNKNGKV